MTCKQASPTQDTTYPNTYNWSDSPDACTCGGLYCSIELIVKGSHPTTHKVSLKVSQASCYSHHLSQYILRETN